MRPWPAMLSVIALLLALPLAAAPGSGAAAEPPVPANGPAAVTTAAGDDPRACLDLSTNLEVIACAERYRPRKRAT